MKINRTNNLEELSSLQGQIESGGWAWEKPTRNPDPEIEKFVSQLQETKEEKWIKVDYCKRNKEENDTAGYLSLYAAGAAGIWAINHVELKKSNLTGDYEAEIQFDKPKLFILDEFNNKFWETIKNTVFMYNSLANKLRIKEDENKVTVNLYFKITKSKRISNLISFLNQEINF